MKKGEWKAREDCNQTDEEQNKDDACIRTQNKLSMITVEQMVMRMKTVVNK